MKTLSENKRARFDYEFLEKYDAGIELKGFEAKAAVLGRVNLAGAYATVKDGEVWLTNCDIPPYQPKNMPADYDSKRPRRLLLTRGEIAELIGRTKEKGLTLVPIQMYSKSHLVKVELGLGRSRKKADKREVLKKKAAEREIRDFKN
ncbi:SsrA-binding protein SmpB [Patescibacteria group bacterium]|nr:SsrA-binding protein SmpB [Patescibacteria group bacterium]